MKKAKKLGLQSLALVLMAFVLVAGVAFGMTGAWFTDTQTGNAGTITMGNGVKMAAIDLTSPTLTGTRWDATTETVKTATISKTDVMPGDVLAWEFVIDKANVNDAASSDFMARITLTVKYNNVNVTTGDKITYTQTYTYGSDEAVALANGTQTILPKAVTDAKHYTINVSLTLNGPEFKNSDALKGLSVELTVDAIQAANYVDGNWASHTIVAAGTDFGA